MSSVNFLALTISTGDGRRVMGDDGRYRREYWVTVRSDATGRRIRFRFTDSIHNEQLGRVGLDADELLWAFRCFVDDAAIGEGAFEDFAADFGYDTDSYSARLVWRACQSSRLRFGRLFSDGRDPASVLEILSQEGVE